MLTSNLFLISIAVLTLVALAVLGAVLYFAAQRARARPAAERKIVRLRTDSLRTAFRQAIELVEGNIASRAERYNIPWILVLNEGEDARPLPIAQSGVASVLSSDAANAAATQGISWHFFDRGVVIDINAAYLGSPDDDTDEKPWDEFLSLCRGYRPQRPFDSVVVTVPAAMLLADDTDAQLELVRRAKLAHRRLWLAQNRFAVRFAVYVVVTGCESLPGFAHFARALPEPMRASMLGWSSPYDLSATYQSGWIDAAMSGVVRAVSDSVAELLAIGAQEVDACQSLLLPARIDAMRGQLTRYVDELLRPSAYHEPFYLRGVYLTGDSGELAAHAPSFAMPRLPAAQPDALAQAETHAPEMAPSASASSSADLLNELMRQPAFLRDLFEKKIFLEYGLTRPSRSQQLARPVVHRALRWGGVAVLCVWGGGLVVAAWQMSHRNTELLAALGELRAGAQQRALAAQRGQDLPPDWYRRQALGLIAMNQRLSAQSVSSWFMPGSWALIDDLDGRVHDRFQRAFGEIALDTIDRELLARIDMLTGVGRDPSTGQLIIGDSCLAPPGARGDALPPRSLALEDMPEMRALQQYVAAVDQFDAVLQALHRLETPQPGNADALRLVVRYALGAELQGDVSASLPYFQREPGKGRGAASLATGSRALTALVPPLRCTFDKGARQLDDRLFNNNPLLVAERAVRSSLDGLTGAASAGAGFSRVLADYRGIVGAIGTQQELLAAGKGGWIRQPQFAAGTIYERTLTLATQNRLLGEDVAARVRARSESGFQAFTGELAQRFSGPDSGIAWQDKDGRYVVTPERLALRDRLAALLNQPFMAPPRDLALPTVPAGSGLLWDRQQLDQAIALGDVRKRFLDEGLAGLPGPWRDAIVQNVDQQFARLVTDQVAAAAILAPLPADGGSAGFEAALGRITRIKAMLGDMHAMSRADDLDALVSRDALARLRAVDEMLQQSELYAIRQGSAGDGARAPRSPVLTAFGLNDAAALGPYLDQQAARAQALGREAAVYLAALSPADAGTGLALRWQALNRDLERYRLKNPNSRLLMLEQFVQAAAADSGQGVCLSRFAARPAGGDDYFAALHVRLYDGLLARCAQGYFAELQRQWDGFSATFNERVAGRAPFGGGAPGGAANANDTRTADYAELGRVLKRYEPLSATYRASRGDGPLRNIASGVPVHQFIDSFDQVRTLLAPLYPAEEGAPAGYDVSAEFRVNRGAELAGNQIIDWTLAIGAQSLSMRDAPRSLHWDYGSPVTLTLRFAKDSPLLALPDAEQRTLSTDGKSLTWRFADPWSLLSFIARHRIVEPGGRADNTAQLLRFDFPLGSAGTDLTAAPRPARGRVFLRLVLTASGKKMPLPWPQSFPTRAPEWTNL
ncbi:type VI secretion protein IcmF [Cupriavidus necator]|uniref:Type VI secretion protein IcmF n=1 Tax=Cupriavidus necator TaxID=106590 RepID=A0A1U9V2V3_CUPNE|nr:type VI secretion system protein [Cupriavidus necator]AQV98967.1 type VI secretion protein IcmF [Cupriavidus necator]